MYEDIHLHLPPSLFRSREVGSSGAMVLIGKSYRFKKWSVLFTSETSHGKAWIIPSGRWVQKACGKGIDVPFWQKQRSTWETSLDGKTQHQCLVALFSGGGNDVQAWLLLFHCETSPELCYCFILPFSGDTRQTPGCCQAPWAGIIPLQHAHASAAGSCTPVKPLPPTAAVHHGWELSRLVGQTLPWFGWFML